MANRPSRLKWIMSKWLLIPLAIYGLVMYGIYDMFFGFEAGENVAHVDWLPDTASRICWFRNSLNRAVEFDMAEQDFLAWAKSERARDEFMLGELSPLDPAAKEPREVTRYLHFLDPEFRAKAGLPPEPPGGIANIGLAGEKQGGVWTKTRATPKRGWKYEKSTRPDNINIVVYDADQGRVYYNWCAR